MQEPDGQPTAETVDTAAAPRQEHTPGTLSGNRNRDPRTPHGFIAGPARWHRRYRENSVAGRTTIRTTTRLAAAFGCPRAHSCLKGIDRGSGLAPTRIFTRANQQSCATARTAAESARRQSADADQGRWRYCYGLRRGAR